jgi:hypothetical protein
MLRSKVGDLLFHSGLVTVTLVLLVTGVITITSMEFLPYSN